jgi:hypothetical protein
MRTLPVDDGRDLGAEGKREVDAGAGAPGIGQNSTSKLAVLVLLRERAPGPLLHERPIADRLAIERRLELHVGTRAEKDPEPRNVPLAADA